MRLFKIYSHSQVWIGLAGTITLASLTALATIATINQPSYAQGTTFYCDRSKGTLVTFARTQDGRKIPVIRWTSNNYFPPPWTAERRCVEVSRRFQRSHDNGTLKNISIGKLRGETVICAKTSDNTVCTDRNLLFTLKRGVNATAVFNSLLDRRGLAAGRVLKENANPQGADEIDIDFDIYLNNVEAEE